MKHPAEIILNALLLGQEVTMGKYIFALSDDGDLCIVAESHDTSTEERKQILLKSGLEFGAFIKMCNELSFDEVFLIGANGTLQRLNQEKKNQS